ncbi:MAG: hypothetical protein NTY90_04205, partial [Candidatus Micrarchaeota archaeon]|nr:hypothetical protein [Candidatus Micrarchaeota archaeon]
MVLNKATEDNSNETTITVMDEGNNTIPARIVISSALNKPLVDNQTDGTWTGFIEKDAQHFASVYAKGYLPAWSEFYAGDKTTFALTPADDSNSANLTIRVKDEQGNPVVGAAAALFFEDGPVIPVLDAKAKTDANGSLKITGLRRDSLVRAAVSKGTRFNDNTLVALSDAANEAEITLVLYPASLQLSAFNALTNSSVPATFTIYTGNLTVASCSSSAEPCTASVFANIPLQISVVANGYFDLPGFDAVLVPDEARGVSLPLISKASVENSLVYFVGLFNERGEKVNNAELGTAVQARFQVASAAGEKAGLFVRVGESAEAGVSGHSPKVGFYAGSGFDCSGTEAEDYKGTTYKWVDLFYDATRPVGTIFSLDIKVSPTSDRSTLDLYYRSYLVKNGTWLRNPFDQELGVQESTPNKQSCLAESFKVSFPIGAPNTVCSERACVSTTYEQEQPGKTVSGGFGFTSYAVGDCFTGSAWNPACDRGLLQASFRIQDFQNRGLLQASFRIQDFQKDPKKIRVTTDSAFARLIAVEVDTYDGIGGKLRKTFNYADKSGTAEIDASLIKTGIAYRGIIEGTAYIAPSAASAGTPVVVEFDNGGTKATRYDSSILVRTKEQVPLAPPVPERILLEKLDDCFTRDLPDQPAGGGIAIDANKDLGIIMPCTKLAFIVDPIFPADAIPLELKDPVIAYKFVSQDGSDACYEL